MSVVARPAEEFEGTYPVRRGTLSSGELAELARTIADDPSRWEDAVRHDPDQRTYALLHEDDDVTIWLICWSAGHDTGFHDHDVSSAGVAVASGTVVDERLTAFGDPIRRELDPRHGATIEPTEIHRMRHGGGGPAVSIHAYSPPLLRTGAYEIAADGQLLRHAQPGEDALVPAGGE
ncbi:cysteine dioxygenase [Patulibacter minatonensis]|uniref:cysteine dioxygenase n=1 Tax=Patulibacter minatonensis TaxID=298163 RepID=UPI0004B78F44|nr:cysteine dioxygenase family protein [Patulibacter minatonensis]